MFEKDGIVYESEEEYENYLEEIQKKRKKKKVRIIVISILLAFMLFFMHSCYRMLFPVDYHIFTEKRIKIVEEDFNMDLSDVKLERYWYLLVAQDSDTQLTFSEVDDYEEFMKNCFFGEIIVSEIYDEENSEDYVAHYECKIENKGLHIWFYEDDDSYRAEIISYRTVN